MISNNILITFAVALCFMQYSEALKCYECTSTRDGNSCGEKDFTTAREAVCSSQISSTLFKPRCQKFITEDAAGKIVSRGCQTIQSNLSGRVLGENQCIAPNGNIATCLTCETDLCNSANTKQIATFGVLALLVGVIMKIIN